MISHLFPIDFSLLYLSISCPFLLSPENKSKSIGMYCSFYIFAFENRRKSCNTNN